VEQGGPQAAVPHVTPITSPARPSHIGPATPELIGTAAKSGVYVKAAVVHGHNKGLLRSPRFMH
jgi:hypothetical protein